MSLATIVSHDKFYNRLKHKKTRIIIQIRDLHSLLGLLKSKSHLNHPKKSIPGTAPRKKMDYSKENIIIQKYYMKKNLYQ